LTRSDLSAQLRGYVTYDPEEEKFRLQFLSLLGEATSFQRTHFYPGHFTASAWVLNVEKSKTLLLHHAKLNRWLQPGGHADGDTDVRAVALRELSEETGLQPVFVSEHFIDLDVHAIPARKSDPAHDHFDFRFLMIADEFQPIRQNHESTELRWIPLEALERFNADASMLRLRAKTLAIIP
jgi:8-oxo-dGTP pyrophosphatase MutT (NUDIX family)